MKIKIKNTLLYYFIKEEINLHKSLTNSSNFYSYPFMLVCFFAIITLFSKFFFTSFNIQSIAMISINIFFVGGIMSGTFGLYARDFLERRFGDVGRLFQNCLIQPIKLSRVFLTIAVSDSFFYLFWFILPLMVGYAIGIGVLGENFVQVAYLLISSFLSFMCGLLISFIFSVIYERSKNLFLLLFVFFIGLGYYLFLNFNLIDISSFHRFYITHNFIYLLYSILLILLFSFFAYFSVGRDYKTKIKKSQSIKSYSFKSKFDKFIIKDFIDMRRTGDIFAKPFFNVFVPSVLVLLMFSSSKDFALYNLGTIFFAIIIGTLGTQLFNSLIMSDNIAYYKHLPMRLVDFIKPKLILSLIICFLESLFILIVYSYYLNDFSNLIAAIVVTSALLIYNFNLSFYLTGLSPNENLMHTKIFLKYFVLLIPILIIVIAINLFFTKFVVFYYLLFLILSMILGKLYFRLGLRKWDVRE